ncbi:MAG: efflux RND transporter permease subunit [Balneolales bacterium]|nr:efflux RND transporter permease subunit [Balneolales bacterium]
MLHRTIRFFLENRLIAALLLFFLVGWGLATSPFAWDLGIWPRDPVAVDAIPDIGDNQQIVFTEWPGRSPQDIEDQITYPLTTQLLGLPGVRAVRSNSMFGFSAINIIFEDDAEFYWSRARILEKLNALPAGILPEGVQPSLGPDATALGQVFWYTLQGLDPDGNPAGGWDLDELRSIQDFQVKYALSSASGVAEVASIGGFVREYQVDIDPVRMRERGVTVTQIANAVRQSNLDVGARTLEMNRVEYVVRGLGYIRSLADIENSVVAVNNNVPVLIRDVAEVTTGPAQRRGMLDLEGAEAVGGVVVARFGENPLQVIEAVKAKMEEIAPGLPVRTLDNGTRSQVSIVPFYDRSDLILETLGTLEQALTLQILITLIVIIALVMHLRTALLVSALMPVAVLISFILMRHFGVEANVVALAGIAISIGTVVDMGIILTENMLRRLEDAPPAESRIGVIAKAAQEVSPAIVTALLTTIISFLPVFLLEAQEGRLFGPLAFTKTFVLLAALVITLTIIPAFAYWLFTARFDKLLWKKIWSALLVVSGLAAFWLLPWAGFILLGLGLTGLLRAFEVQGLKPGLLSLANTIIIVLGLSWLMSDSWLPLGPENSRLINTLFLVFVVALVLLSFWGFMRVYERALRFFMQRRALFFVLPVLLLFFGALSWLGFSRVFQLPASAAESVGWELRETGLWQSASHTFPGLNREFMPRLDEGSFLLMPTTMPHAGMAEVAEMVQIMDMRVASIPEVSGVLGKIGRVESALDPAPISMFENVVTYHPEFRTDENGRRIRFRVDREGNFVRDENGGLIPDRRGRFYRQWRDHIRSVDDIWSEVAAAATIPGVTSAPKLQPIETRIIMLQTGMRANIGIRVSGPDLQTIDDFSVALEHLIREVEGVRAASVFADRVVGKPYLEIDLQRKALARHGLTVQQVQEVISITVGGMPLTTTVEGRERYPVRVRYAREYRDNPENIARILVPAPDGSQIPLGQLAEIRFATGPMSIRSENTFLNSYVTFDAVPGFAAVEVAENVQRHLDRRIASGALVVPAGVSFTLEGEYRNQQRAAQRLLVIVPVTLLLIFMLIYLQFRSVTQTGIIFSSIALVWAGGFLMLWLWAQPWFMNFSLLGMDIRGLFGMGTVNLSVAVWVGFLALFGIGVDDGVVQATYLRQLFAEKRPGSRAEIIETAIEAGLRRVRPCLMTTATTLLALLPILTSPGRGAEIMTPMAIPLFGGVLFLLLSLFMVPLLYAIAAEYRPDFVIPAPAETTSP